MEPRIIPRQEHHISRKQVSPNAIRTLYRLHRNGFIAYLVGGCVRDLLLSRLPKDFDIVTNASPGQIKRLFRNCRLVGRRFRLAHLHFQEEVLQVSTFRSAAPATVDEEEGTDVGQNSRPPRHLKDDDGMILRDNVYGTPEEDALRRDFTINALAYNIADFSLIDYTSGLSDLEQRLIRPIGDPVLRFTEDPVRMIRAVRFAASHDLVIEPATWEILCDLSATISRASPARLYEEVLKLFLSGCARPVFTLLETSGLLAALFPQLSEWLQGDDQRRTSVLANLAGLDRRCHSGPPLSPAFFLAALFGPLLEEEALKCHRGGIPYQPAVDATGNVFIAELCKTVSTPGRVGSQLSGILALQPSLRRIPPRRVSSLVNRPIFIDALAYFRLITEAGKENPRAIEWWDAFLAAAPLPPAPEPPVNSAPAKRRRKRRARHRSPAETEAT